MKVALSLSILVLAFWALTRPEREPALRPTGTTHPTNGSEFLEAARQSLRSLPPMAAQVELNVEFLGESMKWEGQYLQAGHGVPNYRWDLSLSEPQGTAARIMQVFDGRFLYGWQRWGAETQLHYADLSQIPTWHSRQAQAIAGPSAWFGVGGLAALLEHLSTSFQLTEAGSKTSGGSPPLTFRVVRGEWTEQALRELLREEWNEHWVTGGIQWDRLPKQLPHGVEIWIGSDPYLPSFPYRLIFFHYVRSRGGGWQVVPCATLTMHQVRLLNELPADTFRVPAGDAPPEDLTSDYVNRSRMYLLHPTAASPR